MSWKGKIGRTWGEGRTGTLNGEGAVRNSPYNQNQSPHRRKWRKVYEDSPEVGGRVGRTKAGRRLDGRQWKKVPKQP